MKKTPIARGWDEPADFPMKTLHRLFCAAIAAAILGTVHAGTAVFTSSGTWTVPAGISSVDVLVVAGGGGGAGNAGGGGGAGGVIRNTAFAVTPAASITVTIGAGGSGTTTSNGGDGGNSVFGSLTAIGGGGGGTYATNGRAGGSGGGGGSGEAGDSNSASGGAGTGGQGYAGAHGQQGDAGGSPTPDLGGGGGGSGGAGDISGGGPPTYHFGNAYAAGGGGGGWQDGGTPGGGAWAGDGASGNANGDPAFANTGSGGGGGGGYAGNSGGNGGSGVVIVNWVEPTTIQTFTANGTWTASPGVTSVEVVVVGGGGGGAGNAGGGGGAGGVIHNASYSVTAGVPISITIGAGGSGHTGDGGNGSNSTFGSLTAIGGGGGGTYGSPGLSGGSGGGGGSGETGDFAVGAGGAGTSGQGYAGSYGQLGDMGGVPTADVGGGGGGSGSVGQLWGGGFGVTYFGHAYAAGGGGGGAPGDGTPGGGAWAGDGASGNANGDPAFANTGSGGGGGGGYFGNKGGDGGSGVVVVKWLTQLPAISSATAASGIAGSSFSYTVVATELPSSYSASGLPSGLSINTGTGVISGTPTTGGNYSVTLGATNVLGTTTTTLHLTVVTRETLTSTSDFETGSSYSSGDVNGQQNWLGTASQATVSTADAHGGSRSLKLDSGGAAATATKYFDSTGSPSVAFLDLYVKPVAASSAANSSLIQTESASVGFQIASGKGEVYAFDGVGANQWVATGITFDLNGSNQATSWLRVTLREDYTHHTWDLYVNGVLADYDLAFSSNSESYLRILTLKGHASAATYFDDVVAQSANPLFTDADKDGMADSWETSNGLSTSTDDRNSDHDSDGRTNLEEYFAGTAANNADVTNPTAASAFSVTGTTTTTASLSWTAGTDSGAGTSGVAGYNLYRNGVRLNSSLLPTTPTTYTDTSLSAGSSYTYTLRTVDLAGNVSTAVSVTANTVATGGFEMFTPAP
jgi:hypothetical protein